METKIGSPLILERLCQKLLTKALAYKVPLLSSIFSGLLAYCFAFANKLVNHDEVGMLFSKGVTVSSGRWGLAVMKYIFPNISMPWVYGILSLLLFSVAICIIISLFSIRNKLLQALLAGTIMVFPSLIGLFGYMFTSSSYAVAFLLAVLAIYLIRRKNWRCAFGAICCLTLSISIYQAYICVTASLMVVLMIQMLLSAEEKVGTVIKRGLCYMAFLGISVLGYLIATKLLFALISGGFNGYAQERFSEVPDSIWARVVLAYETFFDVLLRGRYSIVPTAFSRWTHIVLLACLAGMLLVWLVETAAKKPLHGISVLFLVGLLPLAIHSILLVIGLSGMHTLMEYGFVSLYILAAVFAENLLFSRHHRHLATFLTQVSTDIVTFALAAILIANTYVANASYLNLHLQYENTYSFMSNILMELRTHPDFTQDTRVAIIGPWSRPGFYSENLGFADALMSVSGFSWDDLYSWPYFMNYYLGVSIPSANEEEIAAIKQTQTYADMAVYPYSGSMEMIGDILVVKLS